MKLQYSLPLFLLLSTSALPHPSCYLTRFLHTRCVFQVLKNVCLLCCATPRFVFIKKIYIFHRNEQHVLCSLIYTYICIYFVVLGKGYLTFVACLQSLNFSLADFFSVAFLFSLRFFALLAFFSGKSLNAPSPVEKEEHRHRQRLDIYATPSTTWTRTRRAEVAEQQQQAAGNMRQDEAGWGSCQILVLVSGCGATCCPGCVHECVWGVCVCCDQHCWSTHSHTHTPVQTLPGCVVIFFLSVSPAAACHCPHLL